MNEKRDRMMYIKLNDQRMKNRRKRINDNFIKINFLFSLKPSHDQSDLIKLQLDTSSTLFIERIRDN